MVKEIAAQTVEINKIECRYIQKDLHHSRRFSNARQS